jgi:uncharacterized membrane protein
MSNLKLFLALAPIMFAIDILWIGIVMKDFYRGHLGHLMGDAVNWIPGSVFYALFLAGLIYFAVLPGVASGSLVRTFLIGAFFGLVAYGTYDLTNHATLKEWPLIVTIVDMLWGAFLSGTLASVGFFLHRWFA